MITIYKTDNKRIAKGGKFIAGEFRGLSSDEKPTTINNLLVDNGSMFVEINTGKIYLYDLDNKEWEEI